MNNIANHVKYVLNKILQQRLEFYFFNTILQIFAKYLLAVTNNLVNRY